MSLKKDLFVALCDHLEAKITPSGELPGVKWIDKDLGQFELMQQGVISFPLPAILLSFPDAEYNTMLSHDQSGIGTLRVRIGYENYYDATTGSPNRNKALLFFDFNEKVHNAVNSFKMASISGLKRIAEAEDIDHESIIITEVIYQFTLYALAEDNNQYTSADPKPRIGEINRSTNTIPVYHIPGK